MALRLAERQGSLLDDGTRLCSGAVPQALVYDLLHREPDRLIPDEMFTACSLIGAPRRCVPPSVAATVTALQRLEDLLDREAVVRPAPLMPAGEYMPAWAVTAVVVS